MASHNSEFCATKDLNLQAMFKNTYNSLTSQVDEAMGEDGPTNMTLVRSMNVSINNLIKVPEGLTKNILILNLSRNRIKSLNGIEVCSRLIFLNASHN